MRERLLEAEQAGEAAEAKGVQLEELLAEEKVRPWHSCVWKSKMLVAVLSLKCVWFAQAKYREKEEELAEAIDRLEEEMRYASHTPHSNDHKPRWRHGMMHHRSAFK